MSRISIRTMDLVLALLLAAAAFGATLARAARVTRGTERVYSSDDVWFESDTYRRFRSMTDRTDPATLTHVHPLFSLITLPPTKAFRVMGAGPLRAVELVLSVVAAAWLVALFALQRLWGVPRPDAIIYSLLALVSAAAVFWTPVPETFTLGALSLLLPLILLAIERYRTVPAGWYVAAGAATLATTVTNWMAGGLATLARWRLKETVAITAASLILVIALAGLQRLVVPHAQFFLTTFYRESASYEQAGGAFERGRALLAHSMVAPQPVRTTRQMDGKKILSVEYQAAGTGSPVGRPALAAWLVLLGLGLFATLRGAAPERRVVQRVLLLLVLGQLLLHLVAGDELFLYGMHVAPLLVLVAAQASFGRWRIPALGIASALVVALGYHNHLQFGRAVELAYQLVMR